MASLGAQSVAVQVCHDAMSAAAMSHEYVAIVLAGTVLDVTACERAAWFLATHSQVPCVTGAIAGTPVDASASALQFLMLRTTVASRLLPTDNVLAPATAIALLLGVHGDTGRGAGWLAEPVIRTPADAAATSSIHHEARAALRSLGLDDAALLDMSAAGLPVHPQQQLMHVEPPPLTVTQAPTSGMRILVLVQGFPMGGYTAFNADLLPRLARCGHTITTCLTEWWRSDWRLEQVRETSPDIHHVAGAVPPMAMPAYIDWLLTTRAIDVVLLSHSYLGLRLLPWLRARHPDVAFVDYVHTDWFEAGMYGSYATMAMQWNGQLDAQLATSDALVTQLVSGGCDADGVQAAHIGIDTAAWQHAGPRQAEIRTSLGATRDTTVLLFSGRLSAEKRPHLAVEVLAQLRAEGRDVLLIFAGSGPLLQATVERAEKLGLLAVCKFLGEVDEHTLRHVYAAGDVFIAPSEIEGIARSLYEAMSMGCVPVVSDVGGQRELVVPGTGSLVAADRDDAQPYVDGVRPWLDAGTRARASKAARAHVVQHFDVRRTVTKVTDTLQLARRRRQSRQDTLPDAMASELAVMAIETIRRHVLRQMQR